MAFPSEANSVHDTDTDTSLESVTAALSAHSVTAHEDEPLARGGREGLPKTYRSRHDPHYVEQLGTSAAMPLLRMLPTAQIDAANLPDAALVEELRDSIAQHGLLQPLLVRAHGGRFALIAGRRRLAAARAARLREVPCLVFTITEEQAAQLGAASNIRARVPEPTVASAPHEDPSVPCDPLTAGTLSEIHHALGTVRGCLGWLPRPRLTTRERVAARLLAADLDRAEWLVKARQYLGGALPVSLRPVKVADLLADLRATSAAITLHGAALSVEGTPEHEITCDRALLVAAIRGLAWALLALGESSGDMRVRVNLGTSGAATAITVRHPSIVLEQPSLLQFFDPDAARPGGAGVQLAVALARYAAVQHRAGIAAGSAPDMGTEVAITLDE